MHTYTYYIHTCIHTLTCTHIYTYRYTYKLYNIYVYIYIYIYIYACILTYVPSGPDVLKQHPDGGGHTSRGWGGEGPTSCLGHGLDVDTKAELDLSISLRQTDGRIFVPRNGVCIYPTNDT